MQDRPSGVSSTHRPWEWATPPPGLCGRGGRVRAEEDRCRALYQVAIHPAGPPASSSCLHRRLTGRLGPLTPAGAQGEASDYPGLQLPARLPSHPSSEVPGAQLQPSVQGGQEVWVAQTEMSGRRRGTAPLPQGFQDTARAGTVTAPEIPMPCMLPSDRSCRPGKVPRGTFRGHAFGPLGSEPRMVWAPGCQLGRELAQESLDEVMGADSSG